MNSTASALVDLAVELDKTDKLAGVRAQFDLPDDTVYLDGNSLGALPVAAKERALEVVENQWGKDLITSWNRHNWIDLPFSVGEKIAKLIGAQPGQTICCDSISVNLFKLLCGALKMNPERRVIVSQEDNFPTDLYMVQGIESLLGSDKVQLNMVDSEDIISALTTDVAVLMLTHVNFRCGSIHDMAEITRLAHEKGILVIWDLAHSAGVLDLQLDDCKVDFAVGCGYKYLNGGPGAPAFMYVAKRHQQQFQQPMSGWMGHAKPFEFAADYQPAAGMGQNLVGTPSIVSMSILDAAMDVFESLEMQQIRAKSCALTAFFLRCLSEHNLSGSFTLVSPQSAEARGSQISLQHEYAYAICQALIGQHVVADFRAPSILRLGFSPLYTSFHDVLHAVTVLAQVINSRLYLEPRYNQKAKVT